MSEWVSESLTSGAGARRPPTDGAQSESWERFLPKFKKKNVQTKKARKVGDKKEYTPFPPPQQPSKVDLAIESGEYFLSTSSRASKKESEKLARQRGRSEERKRAREAAFVPPQEAARGAGDAGARDDAGRSVKSKNHMRDMIADVTEKLKRRSMQAGGGGAAGGDEAAKFVMRGPADAKTRAERERGGGDGRKKKRRARDGD